SGRSLYCSRARNAVRSWVAVMISSSERTRQAEQMLGHIRQDQVGGDGRYLIQPRFTEFALDIVFAGEAETAVGLQAHVGGFPGGFGGQVLGHVRFRTGVAARI